MSGNVPKNFPIECYWCGCADASSRTKSSGFLLNDGDEETPTRVTSTKKCSWSRLLWQGITALTVTRSPGASTCGGCFDPAEVIMPQSHTLRARSISLLV